MSQGVYSSGEFRLKVAERELWRGDVLLPLNRIVFECIAYLIEHRMRAVGRDELVAAVWGRVDVSDVHLNQAIARARRALADDAQNQHTIRTVHGFGYRWVAEIESLPEPGDVAPAAESPAERAIETAPAVVEPPAPQEASARPARRRWWLAGVAILALAALIGALSLSPRRDRTPEIDPAPAGIAVVVLPVTVDAPADASWVALGAMDLVAGRLRKAKLPVPPSETVVTALHGLGTPPGADDLRRIQERLGSGVLVQGTARQEDAVWTVKLTATESDGVQRRAEARDADVIQAARAAADLLLAALGHAPPIDDSTEAPDLLQARLQQVQAAMLASQLDLARSLLLDLPEDMRVAPDVRYRLAEVDFRSGRNDEASAMVAELMRDPLVQGDPLRHGRVLVLRGNLNFRRSAFDEAGKDFDAAIALLSTVSAPLDLADALTRRGLIRSGPAGYDGASSDFSRARLLAEQAGDRLRVAHAEAGFGVLQIERHRLDLALPYLNAAIAQYEAFGVVDRVVTLRNALSDAYAALLRWPEVMELDKQQWALIDRTGDPALSIFIVNRRGRLLIAQGRYREAEALVADARQRYAQVRPAALRYLDDVEADLAWHQGKADATVAAVDRALETWPRNPGFDRYAYLLLLRQRALWVEGKTGTNPDAAGAPAAGDQVSAIYRAVQAEWAAQQGDAHSASALFGTAMKDAEAIGTPALVALVADAYADWLLANGQADKAAELAGRVAVWAPDDYDCALLRVKVFHALGQRDTWRLALEQAQRLAGERKISAALTTPPEAR